MPVDFLTRYFIAEENAARDARLDGARQSARPGKRRARIERVQRQGIDGRACAVFGWHRETVHGIQALLPAHPKSVDATERGITHGRKAAGPETGRFDFTIEADRVGIQSDWTDIRRVSFLHDVLSRTEKLDTE